MPTQRRAARVLGAVLAFLGGLAVAAIATRQEQPAHQTRTWRAFELPSGHAGYEADVDVIDTEGVCLYTIRGRWGSAGLTPVAIAAVPKTQLPPGTGCQ